MQLDAERLPRVSPRMSAATIDSEYVNVDRQRRCYWAWNIPLLLASVVIVLVGGSALAGAYLWQSRRLSSEMLDRAAAAEEAKEYRDQVKWLTRYTRLAPDDTVALIGLGIATDNAAETYSDLNQARVRLSQAIAATGDQSVFKTQRVELRHRLIKRLLQLGDFWYAEAQRQVIFLAAPPEDAEALNWLAQAMAGQHLAAVNTRATGAKFNKEKEYWQWMAQQPVGLVVREALKHNPDDFALAWLFLNSVVSTPEWFEGSEEKPSDEELEQEAESLYARLAAMHDSGRAQWLAYNFKLKRNPELARSLLQAALPGVLARLTENLKDTKQANSRDAETEASPIETAAAPLPDEDAYQVYWDWDLAESAAAQAVTESRVQDALPIYATLLELSSPAVRRDQRESTFLAAGSAHRTAGNAERALEIWTAGSKALKGSIELEKASLTALIDLERIDDADHALKKLEAHIREQMAQLDGVRRTALGPVRKQEYRSRLERASWQTDVYHGSLQMHRGYYRDAAERLAKTFSSPLPIDAASRIQCGRMLADCYDKLQLWDLAGQTLDQCIVLDPNDITVRRLAADAWRLLGAPERAAAQLDSLDDGSFSAALEIAHLKATSAAQTPEPSGVQAVRDALQVARLRWEALPEKERASQPIWMLEMLEIAFTDPQKASRPRDEAFAALAEKYATNPEVQRVAIMNLATQGKIDSAKLAWRRLQKIAEVSGKPEDAGNAIIAEATIAEAANNVDEALRVLRAGIASQPQDGLRLARAGALIATAHRQSAVAYEMLKLVPEESWDIDALMTAGRLGVSSDAGSTVPITDSDLQRWEQKLRSLEGEDGCNWRYLAAKRLISHVGRSPDRAELLEKAEKYFIEIDRIRPRWAIGSALGGQIAAFKGQRDKAIALLRRAIQDGDSQPSTVLLLVNELTALAQFDDAEQELKRISRISQSLVPTSMWEIALAQRKGDLKAALDVARRSTSRNHNDANAWLVAAQTALAVSRSQETPADEKPKLQAEAWDALEHAASITAGKDINVWNARLRFHLELGDKEKVRRELQALEASPLPRNTALLAAANGYLVLQDFETAQARVKEAIAFDPNDAQPHVAMALVLERMGDRPGMLTELQAAHRLDKANPEIRERLAVAYVLASEEIPWAEVDDLLLDTAHSTSANSTLLRALLSLERGDEARIETAMATLSSLANSSGPEALTAKRVLAKQFSKRFVKAAPEDRDSAGIRLSFEQARSLYEELLKIEPPAPADGVSYANLLIEAGQIDEAKQIADKLSSAGTSSLVLQLRLKIAKLQGEDLSSVASSWIASASGFEQEQLWEVVGKTMTQLDLNDEALVWFEKAFAKDPSRFASYTVSLAKTGQIKQAVDLCLSLVQKDGNVEAATLLPEIVMLNPAEQQSEAIERALAAAIKDHADSGPLLEAVATLRLMQERYAEAVALYEQADRLAPNRIRTLNNLAIALAELPGRGKAALERINRAIQLYGKHPQLLDTLAIIQSKLDQHDKAKATLEEALAIDKDPRFQLRLVEELIALGSSTEAKSVWEQIEIDRLKATGLTAAEQRSFNKLSKELGQPE